MKKVQSIDIGVNCDICQEKLEDADPITIGGMVLILLIITSLQIFDYI